MKIVTNILFALALIICSAQAVTIIGNSPAINRTGFNTYFYDNFGVWSFAVGFTMNEPDYSLTSFSADLRYSSVGVEATAGLYANDGPGGNFLGDPGTLLATFNTVTPTSTFETYTFTLTTPYALNDGSTYFIMLNAIGGSAMWSVDNGNIGQNGQTPTSPGGVASPTSQSRWVGGGTSFTDTRIPTYEISASAIPEPGTYALLTAGLIMTCAVGLRGWLRKLRSE